MTGPGMYISRTTGGVTRKFRVESVARVGDGGQVLLKQMAPAVGMQSFESIAVPVLPVDGDGMASAAAWLVSAEGPLAGGTISSGEAEDRELLKASMLAAVKAKRDELAMGLAPTAQGPVEINMKSRSNLEMLKDKWEGLLNPLLVTIKFTNARNEDKQISRAQFMAMKKEIADFTDAVHQRKRALDALIKAPGADLSKIDITGGWPAPGTL